jgi:Zn-dependent protease
MFGQIPPTAYDVRFSLLGIPVRVHPIFWISSLVLAWQGGALDVTAVRVLCIFAAILIHELGHAVVSRSFGFQPEIVLYILGGYATTMRYSTWKDIAVSAAGPAAGFLLFAAVWWWGYWGGIIEPDSPVWNPRIDRLRLDDRRLLLLGEAVRFTLFISLVWNAMNLVPVLPLDGGQISRELCMWANRRRGMEVCLLISFGSAAAIALWALWAKMNNRGVLGLDPVFLAFMFGYLAMQSMQAYQASRRGYY